MKKDMMQSFELFQPRDLDGAVELLDRWGESGWAMAGGYDSLDWFKDRIKTPEAVIDLDGIEELRGHPRDRRRYRDRTTDDAHGGRACAYRSRAVRSARRRCTSRREPTDSQRRHAGRQSVPGYPVLVLPLRAGLLPRRR